MTSNIFSKFRRLNGLFLIFVAIPTFISILYFGFLASDVFVAESKFVVRSPDKPAPTGLGALAGVAGIATGGDEAFAAQAYVESRDALKALEANGFFRKAYARDDIFALERFGTLSFGDSFEQLYKYYLGKVKVETDTTTSISTLTVRAYSPKDAQMVNERILQMAENTINRMNERSREDMIRFALSEVDDAKRQSREASAALAAFRNRRGVIDPEIQATAKLEMIAKLQDQLISAKTQLNQLRQFTPQNPQIPVIENRIRTLSGEIKDQSGMLTGSDTSLAANSGQYQRLFVENEFAGLQLKAALASLQEARNDARRQQVYVQRIAQPNLPDSPIEPRRLRAILATFVLGLLIWGIASMLMAGVKEHAQ